MWIHTVDHARPSDASLSVVVGSQARSIKYLSITVSRILNSKTSSGFRGLDTRWWTRATGRRNSMGALYGWTGAGTTGDGGGGGVEVVGQVKGGRVGVTGGMGMAGAVTRVSVKLYP